MKKFRFKTLSTFMLCIALCIGNFNFAWTAEAAVDAIQDGVAKVYDDGKGNTMPYRVFVPTNYSADQTYPVIVFLHGHGGQGTDNQGQLWNMLQQLFWSQPKAEQALIIAPQCAPGKRWVETDWTQGNYDSDAIPEEQLGLVMKILEEVQGDYSTDDDRIYAMGLSMGGFGTWNLLMKHSDVFAAGVPVCGGADLSKAELLKDIPIWTFHGTADDTVPYSGTEDMVEAIQAVGGNEIIFTTYEGLGHYVWDEAAKQTGLLDWLFSKKLSKRGMVAEFAPEITGTKYLAARKVISMKVDTTESFGQWKTGTLILAAYDEHDKLIQMQRRPESAPESKSITFNLQSDIVPAYVKVLLWNTSSDTEPISYPGFAKIAN